MLSGSHEQVAQKSLEMKQEDKFFTRIMSKDTSMANSSCRVYYGGASSAIPFLWESTPGTPKHQFSDTKIPPLAPPPSYYSSPSISKSMNKSTKSNLFSAIFSRSRNKTHVSPSSSMSSTTTIYYSSSLSSSSSSSWPSSIKSSPSPSTFKILKSQKHLCFLCSRSSIHDNEDDDDTDRHGFESNASRFCQNKYNNKGCYLMKNMKNACFAIVEHGSS